MNVRIQFLGTIPIEQRLALAEKLKTWYQAGRDYPCYRLSINLSLVMNNIVLFDELKQQSKISY